MHLLLQQQQQQRHWQGLTQQQQHQQPATPVTAPHQAANSTKVMTQCSIDRRYCSRGRG